MSVICRNRAQCVALGVLHGMAAWSAYAVVEFLFSSVVFRLMRPYAIFTPLHWRLTGMLAAGYLLAGAAAGAITGLLVWQAVRARDGAAKTGRLLETAAALSVALVFLVRVAVAPDAPTMRERLILAAGAAIVAALLTAALLSEEWQVRLGFLAHPFIAAAILLYIGQTQDILHKEGLARQFGFQPWFIDGVLIAGICLLIAVPLLVGRRWGARRQDRFAMFRTGWASIAAALLLAACMAWPSAPEPGGNAAAAPMAAANTGRPNVLLIVLDTVRADHLSVYGYQRDTTPNLKRLAQNSLVFTNALAPSDITLTSHASLFTGDYPSWHGAYCEPPQSPFGRALNTNVPTLAELLSAQGYTTLGVSANLYMRAEFGLQRGFQSFRIPRPVPVLADEGWYMLRRLVRRGLNAVADTAQFDRLYAQGEDVDRELFASLERRPPEKPFFVFLNFMDAHFPYIPPAPFDRRYPGKKRGLTQADLQQVQNRVTLGAEMPEAVRTHCIAQYDGGIAYADLQIGRIIDWLKARSLYNNTMIVVASDHGESFGEKHLVMHANSPYHNLLHVALLVKPPQGGPSGTVTQPVSLIDVAPTVLAAVGVPAPPGTQGRSLFEPAAPRKIYSETFPCPALHTPDCPGCKARVVVSWPYKFIAFSNGNRELYDLAADPGETRNLFVRRDARSDALRDDLLAFMKTIPVQSQQGVKLDPESVQRLRSLGYVQ